MISWRHDMGNFQRYRTFVREIVTSGFPDREPVMQSFDFVVSMNELLKLVELSVIWNAKTLM